MGAFSNIVLPDVDSESFKREMNRVAEKKWSIDFKHAYENWSHELKQMQLCRPETVVSIPLHKTDLMALADLADGKIRDVGDVRISGLTEAFQRASAYIPKLSSRSPKDFLSDGNGDIAPVRCPSDVIIALASSLRTFEDIALYMAITTPTQPLFLHLFPYRRDVALHKRGEWRCFIRRGTLHAIIQYNKGLNIGTSLMEPRQLSRAVQALVAKAQPHITLSTYCIDVYWECAPPGIMRVIELNPYYQSDPIILSPEQVDESYRRCIDGEGITIAYNGYLPYRATDCCDDVILHATLGMEDV